MKISRDWLSDFIEWQETDPQVIADRLTRCTGEVEEIEEPGLRLKGCCIGKILSVKKHPNADKLSLCDVQTDQGQKRVVCGGTNLREGMITVFAHVGATVKRAAAGGEVVTIQHMTIRGEDSNGMICAAEELGLEERFPPKLEEGARPVLDFTSLGLMVGDAVAKALGMNDVIFHIDNHAITNRSDLFSHVGVARELVALGLAKWKKIPKMKKLKFPITDLPFKRTNEVPDLVPKYSACIVAIEAIGMTPDWMRRRLEALGSRSINLPVDITNYVSLELGMPLHSFDVADLKGTVRIRTAKKGEKIITLDKVERVLPEGAVILSDDEGVFDLLGIMGGLRSSTKDSTRQLYLHAAIVDPISIRKTIISTGHRTDAATVYEKGIPFVAAEEGFRRALELMLELLPGAKIISSFESVGKTGKKKPLKLPADMFRQVIGAEIKPAQAKRILSDLGFGVKTSRKTFTVTPPPWRNDILLKQDVIEEVARIFGYANVPASMPEASTTPPLRDRRIHRMRDALKESGFTELIHVAFTSPQLLAKMAVGKEAVALENPIGEEMSLLRPSLLPSMLLTTARELKTLDAPRLKVYEIGHAFSKGKEWNELVLLIAARSETTLKDDPLLLLKAATVNALESAGHMVTVRSSSDIHAMGHPGRCAELLCGEKRIGLLFEVHPRIRAATELPFRAAACIIDADTLLSLVPETRIFASLPAFPEISFDETLPLEAGTEHAQVLARLSSAEALLRSVETVDLYEANGARTITLRFTYRAPDRTLTQEEVEKVHAKVVNRLTEK